MLHACYKIYLCKGSFSFSILQSSSEKVIFASEASSKFCIEFQVDCGYNL